MVKNIIFDFDGVILDSMPVRSIGFKKIFNDYEDIYVEELLSFHEDNGGLSRFIKIKYFFEKILKRNITEEEILFFAEKFSKIMKDELVNKKYLIDETLYFIRNNFKKYNLHIASGSEEKELNYLCLELDIEKYFLTIQGSPTHKNEIVKNILESNDYLKTETILIGDSVNDYEAARINSIYFYGYNNLELKNKGYYIDSFSKDMFFESK